MSIFSQYFWKRIYWNIHDFKYNVKQIFSIIPIVWNSWDGDFSYLLDLMIWKLERMDKMFHSPTWVNHFVDQEETNAQIRQTLKELKLYSSDDELPETIKKLEKHEKKWGKRATDRIGQDNFPHLKTDEDKAQAMKELVDCWIFDDKEKAKLLKAAFTRISNNIQRWWL